MLVADEDSSETCETCDRCGSPLDGELSVPHILAERAFDRWMRHLTKCLTCQRADEKSNYEALCSNGQYRLDSWLELEDHNGTLDE